MNGFRRNITLEIGRTEDNGIVVTGTMADRFHDISVECVVDPASLAIREIRADFHRAPTDNCRKAQSRLDLLVGFAVGKGLTRKLNETLGGGMGCGNLRLLLTGALPLAINAKAAEGIDDVGEMLDTIHEQLIGTCIGYSEPSGTGSGPAFP